MEIIPIIEVKKHIRNVINKQAFEDLMEKIRITVVNGTEVTCNIDAKKYNSETEVWVKNTFWEISCNENVHSIYCLSEDITNQRNTEAKPAPAEVPPAPESTKLKKKRWFHS